MIGESSLSKNCFPRQLELSGEFVLEYFTKRGLRIMCSRSLRRRKLVVVSKYNTLRKCTDRKLGKESESDWHVQLSFLFLLLLFNLGTAEHK